ncbi:acyl-CoA synthetase [Emcibacter sp.]|uniref:acyl-CoA synthetase n=1 Tax=Emcibacter sp. TaxID=1979954 RepID=UPI003A8E71A8
MIYGSEETEPVLTRANVEAIGQQWPPCDLPESTYDLLRRSAEAYAERVAISYFETVEEHHQTCKLNYRELFQGVTRTANLLHHLDIGKDDVVALLLPNLPETHLALWGAEAAGVVMPLNPFLEAKAISALLSTAQAKLIITFGDDPVLVEKMFDALTEVPTVSDVILVSSESHSDCASLQSHFDAVQSSVKVHDFTECFFNAPEERLVSGRKISPDDVSSYFCTGGTTGLPKIAVRTHGQTIANAWMVRRMIGPAMNKDSVLFCGLPLFHVNAVMITGLAPFFRGASVLIGTPQGYRTRAVIKQFWEIVEHHGVTAFSAVPTLLASLLECPSTDFDLSSFRFAICAASPLSAELLHRFEQTCRISISEAYGMTETSCAASFNPIDGEHRPGSVGLPLPAQEIRTVILDEKGSYIRDADIDEVGLVAIAGPNIFSGYLEPSHNEHVWINRGDGQKWLNSGDLGKIDKDGYLWLTGRAKDLIIRGGHNIDPSVIEEALYAHPEVALAAAVGRPDSRLGELPVAYVQLRDGATVNEADLLAFISKIIGERAAIPKAVTILETLPLTSVGKIHKPTLRHMETVAVTRKTLEDQGIAFSAIDLLVDGVGGATIQILASANEEQPIRDALRLFTFPFQISMM